MDKKLLAFGGVGAIVLLTVAFFGGRASVKEMSLKTTEQGVEKAPTQALPENKSGANHVSERLPAPWLNNSNPPGLAGENSIGAGSRRALQPNSPQMKQELTKFQGEIAKAISDPKHPDTKKILEVMRQMKQNYGSSIGGVNFDALITNIEKAQEMQALAEEIQIETAKSKTPDMNKLNAKMEKIKKLQSELRTDISVSQKNLALVPNK